MGARIECVSFDLWDTIFVDDSDEPKRAARGLPSKAVARRDLVAEYLGRHGPVDRAAIEVAYATADAAFRQVWYGETVTWTVRERLEVLLMGLGRTLPEVELAALVRAHEDMEVDIMPDLAPGVVEVLPILADRYPLAVVSDAIFSPGRALRQILEHYDLLRHFRALVFSDEIGWAKPHHRCFESVSEQIGCSLVGIVHLGDREAKDIDGPLSVGARGVLVPIVKDRGAGPATRAAAVCRDYKDLPGILQALEGGA